MKQRLTKLGGLLQGQISIAILVLHIAIIASSMVFSWLLRLDFSWGDKNLLFATLPILIIVRLAAIRFFRLNHGWWQYTGISEVLDIVKAVALGSVVFWSVVYFGFHFVAFPRAVYVIEGLLTAGLLTGVRVFSRALAEIVRDDLAESERALIVGAGFAGQMILREVRRPASGYTAVGFVDDDPTKTRLRIMGVPVLGAVDELPELVSKHAISQVLIAVPSATSAQMQRFVESCERARVRFRTVPSLRELIVSQPAIPQMREVNLEDLLGREAIRIDLESVRKSLANRVVLVTGAAGSIGSELCRQILIFNPKKLICLDQSETGIFYLQLQLDKTPISTKIQYVVGDFSDRAAVAAVLSENPVGVVFHAAAYKHVPVMEQNVVAAVKNNVVGLVRFLNQVEESGCESFILISSDKAVNPTSIMGATKRIGELITAARDAKSLRCVSVRFGNVLGSNGSLIPILQGQIRNGIPLTITDPEIRRFFMTVQEAVSLVLQAFVIGLHRDILVLDMGESLRILDIAKTLIRLSGKTEDEVQIQFTGLRSGEKFYEELFYDSEEVLASTFPKIKRTKGSTASWAALKKDLDSLDRAIASGSELEIRAAVKQIVPEYMQPNVDAESAGFSSSTGELAFRVAHRV